MKTVNDIRQEFITLLNNNSLSDNGTIEILNAQFIADEPSIFGQINLAYAKTELNWYISQSLNVNDIANCPKIWQAVASSRGEINSNYGWCIFSSDNGNQYINAITALADDKTSRRATMIYTRPEMHDEYNRDGMNDFICTYATQLHIRNNVLSYSVFMRSNDAVYGYKNDKYWHDYVFDKAFADLKENYGDLVKGQMTWHAASLHVYPRHFYLVGVENEPV